jgi:hypothetical protein
VTAVAAPKNPPHPLVAELAKELTKKSGKLSPAGTKYETAAQALQGAAPKPAARQKADNTAGALASELANDPDIPELYTFAGYLGGLLDDPTNTTQINWQIVYLDAKLLTWLLVDEDSIVLRTTVDDDTSPFGKRDYIWLKSDASVSRGEGPPQTNEIQARFLRGDFVSAGDFAASLTGGTFAPTTGPSCPLTPGCCGIRTR